MQPKLGSVCITGSSSARKVMEFRSHRANPRVSHDDRRIMLAWLPPIAASRAAGSKLARLVHRMAEPLRARPIRIETRGLRVDVPNLRRSDDFPLGIARGDDLALGDVAPRTHLPVIGLRKRKG